LHMESSNPSKIQVPPKSNSIAWVSVTQSQRVPSDNTTSTLPFCAHTISADTIFPDIRVLPKPNLIVLNFKMG